MKTTALVLLVVLGASPARAEGAPVQGRGFLTGLGLGLLIGGLTGAGFGVAGVVQASDATGRLAAFQSPLPETEVPSFKAVEARLTAGTTMSMLGFILGGLALAGGLTCLVLDGGATASVVFAPTASGGAFVFSAQF